jgi:hypothetical protein
MIAKGTSWKWFKLTLSNYAQVYKDIIVKRGEIINAEEKNIFSNIVNIISNDNRRWVLALSTSTGLQ